MTCNARGSHSAGPGHALPPRRLPSLLLLCLAAASLGAGGCQGDNAGTSTPGEALRATKRGGETPLSPTADPRLDPYRDRFQRVEALIVRWDGLRNDGRASEADTIAARLRQEVDGAFPDFERAAGGELGVHAQYLAVSALGFSASPQATRVLVARLGDQDSRVVGNALIALGVRADPGTPLEPIVRYVNPQAPVEPRRFAPLTLAKVMEARARAGQPASAGQQVQVLARLTPLAVDHDPVVRLHVANALGRLETPGTYEPLRALVGDPQMRVRWAAAASMERTGDPRGFPDVIRLLNDVSPDSKHVIRDVLVSYAGRVQGRPLTSAEIEALGTGPRAWSQWYSELRSRRGLTSAGAPR
jgi:HEAT repeat protein